MSHQSLLTSPSLPQQVKFGRVTPQVHVSRVISSNFRLRRQQQPKHRTEQRLPGAALCSRGMAAMIEAYVDKVVQILTNDGRNIVGVLKGFDQTTNVILDECHERVYSADAGVEQAPNF